MLMGRHEAGSTPNEAADFSVSVNEFHVSSTVSEHPVLLKVFLVEIGASAERIDMVCLLSMLVLCFLIINYRCQPREPA